MITEKGRVVLQPEGYLHPQAGSGIIWNGVEVNNGAIAEASAGPAVLVSMLNGLELTCSPCQEFKTMLKRLGGISWTKAQDLTSKHYIYFTEETFEFDYLELSCYKYLSKLTSEELGTLVGLIRTLTVTSGLLDIPHIRKGCREGLERLLMRCNVDFKKENYYHRTDRVKYIINSPDFLEEISLFLFDDNFSKYFWQSKPFMKGILKVLFTFGIFSKQMISVKSKAGGELLREAQKALMLFGINSGYSRGFNYSNLILSSDNCYRFAHRIGVFDGEQLFTTLDFKKVIGYKDITFTEMKYGSVQRITKVDGEVPMFKVEAPQFMFDGVIAK